MATLLGTTQTATYMTGATQNGMAAPSFLPAISTNQAASMKPYDSYPAPAPLRRSYTTMEYQPQEYQPQPWRPSTYYGSVQGNPAAQSMPGPLSRGNNLGTMDSDKVAPIFSSSRNALFSRYTPGDWVMSNQSNFLSSDRARSSSERVRLDTVRLCREVDDKTVRTQGDVGRKLGDRLGDIHYWKTEVHNEIDAEVTEIEALNRSKQVLEQALAETENPLKIAQECLYTREKRQTIDLVHDDVEKQLIQEVSTIKACQDEMKALVAASNNQLALCRAAQHELEKDARDKHRALNLDSTCHEMRNTSRGIQFQDGIERVDHTTSVPDSWARFSNTNIARSQAERQASREKRNEIECLLNKSATAMVNQWNTVNGSLNDRTNEYAKAKNELQSHLSRVLQEIFDMEKNIELLKKTVQDKEQPMQVAQTRLATRTQRPNVELCKDPVQHRLVTEVHEINSTVEALRGKLREAEAALQILLRNKHTLEADLAVKANSIWLDREGCMGRRKTFPMSPRVTAY